MNNINMPTPKSRNVGDIIMYISNNSNNASLNGKATVVKVVSDWRPYYIRLHSFPDKSRMLVYASECHDI